MQLQVCCLAVSSVFFQVVPIGSCCEIFWVFLMVLWCFRGITLVYSCLGIAQNVSMWLLGWCFMVVMVFWMVPRFSYVGMQFVLGSG